jgi:hypothetical protein
MELSNKLIDWINKTGYPLEIFAESLLARKDFKVINSHIYHDDENNIFRELDLFAIRTWNNNNCSIYLEINLLIECKKSTKPFILINNHSLKPDSYSLGALYGTDDLLNYLFLSGSPKNIPMPENYENGTKLIQGFVDNDETIYKAMNTLIKSFNFTIKRENEFEEDYKKDNVHSICIPILLIDAPFYALQLNQMLEIELSEIESGIIEYLSHLNRYQLCPFPIPVIRKNQMSLFIESIEQFG